MTRYRVWHRTHYDYAADATLGINLCHLLPRDTPSQRVQDAVLAVSPAPDDRADGLDDFGNRQSYVAVEHAHDALELVALSVVDVAEPIVSPTADEPWESARDAAVDPVREARYRLASEFVPRLDAASVVAEEFFPAGRPIREAVTHLTSSIHERWSYEPGATHIATPLAEVFAERHGVCQDFAHLSVAVLRAAGLPVRYVSGYLETRPAPGTPKLVGADASHAWASVRLADGTWLDFDPTNDVVAPSTHVTVGWGRDYADVVPVKGVVVSAGGSRLTVGVDVARVGPDVSVADAMVAPDLDAAGTSARSS